MLTVGAIAGNEENIIGTFLERHRLADRFLIHCNGTDNTRGVISDWFRNTPETPPTRVDVDTVKWVDFATNRNELLDAFDAHSTDTPGSWMLMLDCDWHFDGDLRALAAWLDRQGPNITAVNVALQSGAGDVVFKRPLLTRAGMTQRYRGRRHEFLDIIAPVDMPSDLGIVRFWPEGHRSQRPAVELFLEDAAILLEDYFEHAKTNPDFAARCAFYAAQSFRDAGDVERWCKWSNVRADDQAGYWQERYVALLWAGRAARALGHPEEEVHRRFLQAAALDPNRREALVELTGSLWRLGAVRPAYAMAVEAARLRGDSGHALFAEVASNDYWVLYNLAFLAGVMGCWKVHATALRSFKLRWPDDVNALAALHEVGRKSNP